MLKRPGVWLRSGMAGVVCGINLVDALASLPADVDREFSRSLFIIAETEFVAAVIQSRVEEDGDDD